MLKLSLKTVLARKRRLVLTAFSVVIGIAFLAGTLVFTDTIQRTFDNLFADVNKNTDAYVRSAQEFDLGFGQTTRDRLPADLVATVAAVPGVTQAESDISGAAVIIGKDGKQLGNAQNGAPQFGQNIYGGDLSAWTMAEGRLPTAGELVIDRASFKKGDFALGDQVTVVSQGGSKQFPLVGVVKFGDADTAGGATFALFDNATAEAFVGTAGEVDAIVAKGEGVSQEELASRIRSAVPDSAEVLTGEEITKQNQSDIRDSLQFFNILLLVFAAVALFVGAFIIYNTFSIIVHQRQRENALLRAIGASRGQIIASLMIESVIIGFVASLLGLALGVLTAKLLEALFSSFGVSIPSSGLVLLPRTILVCLVVGVVITVLSAVVPAIRGSKVPPVAAMREVAFERPAPSAARLFWGLALFAGGGVVLGLGLAGVSPWFIALGVPVLFVGVFVLGPLIARPVANLLGAPLPWLDGITGTLARENATRNPKRTARTAAALMVGVALVAGISVLAASIRTSVRDIFEKQFTGDFVVSTDSFGFGGLPLEAADRLNELPEVEAATGIQLGVARIDDGDTAITVLDPATAGQLFDLDYLQGSISDLGDTSIQVSQSRAKSDSLSLGSTVSVQFLDGSTRDLTVTGIYDRDDLAGPWTVSKALYAQTGADQFDFSVFILKAPGVSDEQAEVAISGVASAFPNAKVQSRSAYIDAQAGQIDTFVTLVYLLLALSIIIALFGIMNTLSLSVWERTKELGLVRAVGATRAQVWRTVGWESVITALLGAVEGIVLGVLLGWAVSLALQSQGLNSFTVPWVVLIFVLVAAVIVGVLAAILPARRAARVDVLRAVTTE